MNPVSYKCWNLKKFNFQLGQKCLTRKSIQCLTGELSVSVLDLSTLDSDINPVNKKYWNLQNTARFQYSFKTRAYIIHLPYWQSEYHHNSDAASTAAFQFNLFLRYKSINGNIGSEQPITKACICKQSIITSFINNLFTLN